MGMRWFLILLFLTGTLLGLTLRGDDASPAPAWAGPLAPILDEGDVGLAQRIAPAVNHLLLTPTQNRAYLPMIKTE